MKSLNKYISEGIFSNLGISDAIDNATVGEWVDTYNRMVKNRGERATIIENNTVLIKEKLYITDAQLENGKLPDYIKFRFDCNDNLNFHVKVNAKTFCSTAGFPVITGRCQRWARYCFFIDMSADTIDFSYLPVELSTVAIYNANLGPKDLSSLPKIMTNIKIQNLTKSNCNVIATIPKNLKLYSEISACTQVDLDGDMRGCEQILADFFKNTTIDSKTHDGAIDIRDLVVSDFDFLSNTKTPSKFRLITGIALDKYDDFVDNAESLFKPLEENGNIRDVRFAYSERNPYNISTKILVKLEKQVISKRGYFMSKKCEIW